MLAAAGVAVALGMAAGAPGSSTWAWGFVMVGALQVVAYLQLGWHLLAALTAAATAIEIVLLGCLTIHRVGTNLGSVTRV